MHNIAVEALANTFGRFVWDGGMLTDELRASLNGLSMSDQPPDAKPPGGWFYSDDDIWRRLSSKDVRILPERWDPFDMGGKQGASSREQWLDQGYNHMQGARGIFSTAVGQLATATPAAVGTADAKVMLGELYALQGYADVLLADLFCSGVPLNAVEEEPLKKLLANAPMGSLEHIFTQASSPGFVGVSFLKSGE